jgi:hypothetical protein
MKEPANRFGRRVILCQIGWICFGMHAASDFSNLISILLLSLLGAVATGSLIESYKTTFNAALILLAFCIAPIANAAPCNVQHFHHGHHHQAGHYVDVPFALPIGVPVAVASPYWYGPNPYGHHQSSASAMQASGQEAVKQKQTEKPKPTPAAREKLQSGTSLVAHYCGKCHGSAKPDGGLSLKDLKLVPLDRRVLAVRKILGRKMPPSAEKEALPPGDVAGLIEELTREPEPTGEKNAESEDPFQAE